MHFASLFTRHFTLKLGFKHGSMDSQGRGVVMQQQGIVVQRPYIFLFYEKTRIKAGKNF